MTTAERRKLREEMELCGQMRDSYRRRGDLHTAEQWEMKGWALKRILHHDDRARYTPPDDQFLRKVAA